MAPLYAIGKGKGNIAQIELSAARRKVCKTLNPKRLWPNVTPSPDPFTWPLHNACKRGALCRPPAMESYGDLAENTAALRRLVAQVPGGAAADICIFNPDLNWQLSESNIHGSGKNSPFIGWNFQTRVEHTIVGGTLIHSHSD